MGLALDDNEKSVLTIPLKMSVLLVLPVNVSVHGLIPASRLEVPKSDIFTTPL